MKLLLSASCKMASLQ